jgi:hypothetical protein
MSKRTKEILARIMLLGEKRWNLKHSEEDWL